MLNEENKSALVPKPQNAVEKVAPGANRILLRMTVETLAVARKADVLRREEAESWFQKGKQLWQKAGELFDTVREVVVRLHKMAASADGKEAIACFQKAAELGHAANVAGDCLSIFRKRLFGIHSLLTAAEERQAVYRQSVKPIAS